MQFHEIINFVANNKLGSQPPPPRCFYSLNISFFVHVLSMRLCAILMNFFYIGNGRACHECAASWRKAAERSSMLQPKGNCKMNLLEAIFLLETFINIYSQDFNPECQNMRIFEIIWKITRSGEKVYFLKVPDSKLNNISFFCAFETYFSHLFRDEEHFPPSPQQKSFSCDELFRTKLSQSRGCAEVSWKRDGKIGRRRRMQRRWEMLLSVELMQFPLWFLRKFPKGRINKTNWLMHLQKV